MEITRVSAWQSAKLSFLSAEMLQCVYSFVCFDNDNNVNSISE